MDSHPLKVFPFLCCCLLCGCELFHSKPQAPPDPPAAEVSTNKTIDLPTRNNALALLDDLLNDEKNLSKVLIVKHHSEQLGTLVKNISSVAGQGAKMLDSMAKKDAWLDLKRFDLPQGETATREAIAKSKEHTLLHTADAEFQFQLLLTQEDALNYGAHLAQVAAANEPEEQSRRKLSSLSAQLSGLHEQVLVMLREGHYVAFDVPYSARCYAGGDAAARRPYLAHPLLITSRKLISSRKLSTPITSVAKNIV